MLATHTLVLLTSAAFATIAPMLTAFEVERRRSRRVLASALLSPPAVEKACS